jgi:hypothetical protein
MVADSGGLTASLEAATVPEERNEGGGKTTAQRAAYRTANEVGRALTSTSRRLSRRR